MRPRLLDLFSGAGGAAMGYHRAGFDVVGVDIVDCPSYPFKFVRGDALDIDPRLFAEFDAIHASPPCQGYLNLTAANAALGRESKHDRMIHVVRDMLAATGLPYVIENVMDARRDMTDPVRLCGTSFGLPIRRHRLFESNIALDGTACAHGRFTEPKYWTSWRPNGEHRLSTVVQVYGNGANSHEWGPALGIDWMTPAELKLAIPPAYTEHIGRQLLAALNLPQ